MTEFGLAILEGNEKGKKAISRRYMEELGCWLESDIQAAKDAGEITETGMGYFLATPKMVKEWAAFCEAERRNSQREFERETRTMFGYSR